MENCLYRMIGVCPNCKPDYGDHHPNNLDCPRYRKVGGFEINVSIRKDTSVESREQGNLSLLEKPTIWTNQRKLRFNSKSMWWSSN